MKKIITFLVLLAAGLYAQSWNNAITTGLNVSSATRFEMHTTMYGNNVAVETNGQLKVYLIDVDGNIIRTSTIESGGVSLTNICGDGEYVYVIYEKDDIVRGKYSVNGGASWSPIDNLSVNPTDLDAVYYNGKVHITYRKNSKIYYRQYRHNSGGWSQPANVSNNETGSGPHITILKSQEKVYVSYGYDNCKCKTREYDVGAVTWDALRTIYYYCVPGILASEFVVNGTTEDYLYFYYSQYYESGNHRTRVAKIRKSDYVKVADGSLATLFNSAYFTTTADNSIHSAYHWYGVSDPLSSQNPGIRHSKYGGNEISETIYDLEEPVDNVLISSAYNDLHVMWEDPSSHYLTYKQYDTNPQTPQSFAGQNYNN